MTAIAQKHLRCRQAMGFMDRRAGHDDLRSLQRSHHVERSCARQRALEASPRSARLWSASFGLVRQQPHPRRRSLPNLPSRCLPRRLHHPSTSLCCYRYHLPRRHQMHIGTPLVPGRSHPTEAESVTSQPADRLPSTVTPYPGPRWRSRSRGDIINAPRSTIGKPLVGTLRRCRVTDCQLECHSATIADVRLSMTLNPAIERLGRQSLFRRTRLRRSS